MRRMVEERDLLLARAYARQALEVLGRFEGKPPPEAWDDLFSEARVGRRGVVYLLDSAGFVAYHPDPMLRGADYRGHTGISEALSRGEGSTFCHAPEGVDMYLTYAAVGETGWRVVVEEPWEDLVDPILRLPGLVPFRGNGRNCGRAGPGL